VDIKVFSMQVKKVLTSGFEMSIVAKHNIFHYLKIEKDLDHPLILEKEFKMV